MHQRPTPLYGAGGCDEDALASLTVLSLTVEGR
jgi:hypothetical protein